MNTKELELIWSRQNESGFYETPLSLHEIQKTTLEFSSERVSSGQRTILFDTIYKGLVLTGSVILIFIGELTPFKLALSVLILACLLYLIYRNGVLNRLLGSINDANPIIDVLKQRYDILNRFYREFLFSSSITHPLFVFTGFQFYYFFRYGKGQFDQIISDPVTYVFLTLAFLIPFVTQRVTYSQLINEMEQILSIEIEEVEQELKVIEFQAKRRARKVIFTTITLVGITILLILIINLL